MEVSHLLQQPGAGFPSHLQGPGPEEVCQQGKDANPHTITLRSYVPCKTRKRWGEGHWLHFDLDSGMSGSSKTGDGLPAPEMDVA